MLNELVSIEFVVHLQKSVKGNIHILTMVDNFSKLFKMYVMKDCTASRLVYDYCLIYGTPENMHSDKVQLLK